MRKSFLRKILAANNNEIIIEDILIEFESAVQEQFIINLLIEKRNKKFNDICWNKDKCIFISSDPNYMKCWQDNYSVDQCKQDNIEHWNE